MTLGKSYTGLVPLLSVAHSVVTENGVQVYKVDGDTAFTVKFPIDKSTKGFNLTIIAEGIDNTGTVRLWQREDGTGVITAWNELLDNDDNQVSVTVAAADLQSVMNIPNDKCWSGWVGADFAAGSISTGTVYFILGRGD